MKIEATFVGITISLSQSEVNESVTEFLERITKDVKLEKIAKNRFLVIGSEQLPRKFSKTIIYSHDDNNPDLTHHITFAVKHEDVNTIYDRMNI